MWFLVSIGHTISSKLLEKQQFVVLLQHGIGHQQMVIMKK